MLAIFLIHTLIVLAAGFYFMRKKKFVGVARIASWVTFLFFPIGGPLIYWIIYIYQPQHSITEPVEDPSDFTRDMPVFELIEPMDVQKEINIASMEETLLVADYSKRREVVLNILKDDAASGNGYIDMALHNEDSETAHFAASGILHQKRKLDVSISNYAELYRADPDKLVVAYTYSDLLFQYLTTVRLDRADRLFYLHENVQVLEKIVAQNEQGNPVPLIRLIELLIEIEDYEKVELYCNELLENYADSEEKYLILLKSFFMMKNKPRFEVIFEKFRESNIYFSSSTMNIIRLWLVSLSHIKMSAHDG